MADKQEKQRSPAIAAAIILIAVGVGFYFMPNLVLWIADFSPALGFAAGALFIAGFFILFWVRSRFQKR